MLNILEVIENEPRISHRVVAEQTENQQKNINELISKYGSDFEEFGKVPFKTEAIKNSKNRINEQKTFYLNEPQATFLMTLLRNKPVVVEFKKNLVKAFYTLKQEKLNTTQTQQVIDKNFMQNLQHFMQNVSDALVEQSKAITTLTKTVENLVDPEREAREKRKEQYRLVVLESKKTENEPLTTNERDALRGFVSERARELQNRHNLDTAKISQLIFTELNKKFGTKSYGHIKQKDYFDASMFVKFMELNNF